MRIRNRSLFVIFFSFGLLAWSFGVSADTIFTDDFNSYSVGGLSGQGGWQASPAFVITDSPAREGAGALFSSNFNVAVSARKSGTLLNGGKITIYARRADANQPGVFSFILKEGSNPKIEVRGNYGAGARFQHIDGSAGSYVNFGPLFNFETWYAIQIEWRSADHSARYNIDGGIWTDWFSSIAPWDMGLDTVELQTTNSIMWDAIQEAPISSDKTPVLIVPGLIGTELKDGGELLWADVGRMFSDIGDNFLDGLFLNSNLQSVNNISISNVLSAKVVGPFKSDYTDGLITEFKSQGYIENETLFTFPYDWRYGASGKYSNNKTNADLLAEKIQAILQQTGAQKVDIIAHSMGGLIVKQYVVSHIADNHINKAVFVGVPNTGAPKSVKTLLEGDNLGMFFVSQNEIKKISENMPAIYDLLPSQQYYNTKGSYIKVIDQGLLGATSKDLTYSETKTFLANDNNLNITAVSNADNLHTQSFDNFDLRTAGIDLYAIDGCKAGTLGNITQVKSTSILGQPQITYQKPKMVPGDGTVPLESATNLPIDSAKKFYALKGEHSKMMSQDGTRQQIVNILAASTLTVDSSLISQDIGECKLNGKAISVFSPVDIYVTDQDGKKLGLAEDGSIFNEIPNADFQIWGTHKFLYLPTDDGQVYEIKIDGTGTGTYTIKTDDIENNEEVKTQVFSNLPVTADLIGSINFGQNGANDFLIIKQQVDSQPETILPSPPEVVIEFDPAAQDLKFFSPESSVTVTDNNNVITLADQAGNVTEITLKEKGRKKSMKAEIKSIKYNGVAANITKNVMQYSWVLDKTGQLKKFEQHIKSRKDYNITAVFDGKNTKITGKDFPSKISKSFTGLKIIKITTNKGDFTWSY